MASRSPLLFIRSSLIQEPNKINKKPLPRQLRNFVMWEGTHMSHNFVTVVANYRQKSLIPSWSLIHNIGYIIQTGRLLPWDKSCQHAPFNVEEWPKISTYRYVFYNFSTKLKNYFFDLCLRCFLTKNHHTIVFLTFLLPITFFAGAWPAGSECYCIITYWKLCLLHACSLRIANITQFCDMQ